MTPGGHCTQGSDCISSEKQVKHKRVTHSFAEQIYRNDSSSYYQWEYIFNGIYMFTCLYIANYCITGIDTQTYLKIIKDKTWFSVQWNQREHTGSISAQSYTTYESDFLFSFDFPARLLKEGRGWWGRSTVGAGGCLAPGCSRKGSVR